MLLFTDTVVHKSVLDNASGIDAAIILNAFTIQDKGDSYALDFASNRYAFIGHNSSLNFGDEVTLAFQIQTTQTGSVRIASKFGTNGWLVDNPANIRVRVASNGNVDYNTGVAINDGQVHWLGFTFKRNNSAGLKVYVDGVQIGTSQDTTLVNSLAWTADMQLAALTGFGGTRLVGLMDTVVYYDRELSALEMFRMAKDKIIPTSGLRVYLPCNEGAGTTIRDYSGFGNDFAFASTAAWAAFGTPDHNTATELVEVQQTLQVGEGVVFDDFNRADGAIGYTSVGNFPWTTNLGNWVIQSNQLRNTENADERNVTVPGFGNFIASLDMYFSANSGNGGITFRYVSATQYYGVRISYANSVVVFKRTGGTSAAVQSTTYPPGFTAGNTYNLTVIVSGGTITYYVNGTYLNTYTMSAGDLTAYHPGLTTIGIRATSSTSLYFDNFQVKAFNAAEVVGLSVNAILTDSGQGTDIAAILASMQLNDAGTVSEVIQLYMSLALSDNAQSATEAIQILATLALEDNGIGNTSLAILNGLIITELPTGIDIVQVIKPTVYPHRSATLLQKNKVGTYLDIIKTKTKLEVVRKSTILK